MKVYELIQALAEYKADDEVTFFYARTLDGQEVIDNNGNHLEAEVDVEESAEVYEFSKTDKGVCLMLE